MPSIRERCAQERVHKSILKINNFDRTLRRSTAPRRRPSFSQPAMPGCTAARPRASCGGARTGMNCTQNGAWSTPRARCAPPHEHESSHAKQKQGRCLQPLRTAAYGCVTACVDSLAAAPRFRTAAIWLPVVQCSRSTIIALG